MLPKLVYFYVQPADRLGYQHNAISLAQGFRALGIPYAASADYWMEPDGNLLFKDQDVDPRTADLVILTEQYLTYGDGQLPAGFFDLPGKKVLITTADGVGLHKHMRKPFYRQYDLILTFIYEGLPYPANIRGWAFGLTQQMIDLARPELPKEPRICLNYRNSHSVRKLSQAVLFDQLDPAMIDSTREQFDWQALKDSPDYAEYIVYQSAGRHNRAYLERIARSAATSAFGGDFYLKPWVWNWLTFKLINYFVDSAASIGRMNRLFKSIGIHTNHTYRIYQWDSWRFWEALAAGSMAINVDFAKYHIRLPEMPVNYQHYLGADLRQPAQALAVLRDPARMQAIGVAGKDWALTHYAPRPQAERLLHYLETLPK
jgi:hypothetical protein